jgi:acetyl-CoA C-acetyltransferase
VWITGWGHTRFGLLDDTLESLAVQASREALRSANVQAGEVGEICVGHYNGGLGSVGYLLGLAAQADGHERFAPGTRIQNACATGAAAVQQAFRSLRSGAADAVLVLGAERMTVAAPSWAEREPYGARSTPAAPKDNAGRNSPVGFATLFARIATTYSERYGDAGDTLAQIAAKNLRNGVDNPWAALHTDPGVEFCQRAGPGNPMVAAPLRRTDCAPAADGAAALVLTRAGTALAGRARHAARLRSVGQAADYTPGHSRDLLTFAGARTAWERCLTAGGLDVNDLDLIELHDCFTIAELLLYEALGLSAPGKGRQVIDQGWSLADGRLPVNRSGGLTARGHPIGATGVSQHVMAALQLTDSADAMQLPVATRAGVFTMGGIGVSNYASVLERIR